MDIILFTKRRERPLTLRVTEPRSLVLLGTAVLLLAALLMGAGYRLSLLINPPELDTETVAAWRQEVQGQRQAVADARQQAESYVDALALRTGQLQANVLRLNALGQRLTKMAGLESGEFDFEQAPAQGGPEQRLDGDEAEGVDLVRALNELAAELEDREHQLSALEAMLLHGNLQRQVHPTGRPITSGWLSSQFGKRSDPFTGKPVYHNGVDFAGKAGSDVVAVASGVVTWSGERYGYGNMVELDHGNGYVTRYGHNQENQVQVGERVAQGQRIALMGSSGRSTGPHVHFEVLHNGRVVNPAKYIKAQR